MRRLGLTAALQLLAASALAQSLPPANITTDPSTTPEVVQVLDQAGHWAPMGTVDSTTHIFTPVGGGAPPPATQTYPILATDPAIGFTAGGTFDNHAQIRNLMLAIGPDPGTFPGGYDVVIPGIPGQAWTAYYFSDALELSRSAHYRCASTSAIGFYNSVELVFPAGVDGVIQADSSVSPEGGIGGGTVEGCGIISMGSGSGYSGAGATTINSVNQNGEVSGVVHPVAWAVGDGILATPARAGFHPTSDEPVIAHGAYLSGVGSTLTLAAGYQIANNFYLSQQEFLQNGSNNFLASDAMVVGNNTFTFVTGTPTTGQIKIGANWAATAASLISAINTNAADPLGVSWGKPTNTPNLTANTFGVGGHVYFAANTGGAVGDAFPATFTTSGAAAGTFDAYFVAGLSPLFVNGDTMVVGNTTMHFKTGALTTAGDVKVGADNETTENNIRAALGGTCSGANCVNPSPAADSRVLNITDIGALTGSYMQIYSTAGGGATTYTGSAGAFGGTAFNGSGTTFGGGKARDQLALWQLPATRRYFGVTATLGSASITVSGGPRPLRQGDWIWSKAFTYGATVLSTSGKTFPQTVTIGNAFASGSMNAIANDSGGQLWVIPTALKRETIANTSNNSYSGFPNGFQESCIGFVCAGNDTSNAYGGDMLGRIIQGHNTAGTNSFGEYDHVSTLAAVFEGGTLGSNYYGFSANTNDNGAWSFIGNCVNQNTTLFLGGYAPATNPYCADQNQIFPTTNSGNMPIFMGQSNGHGPPGSPDIQTGQGNGMAVSGGFQFSSGTSYCLFGDHQTFSSDNACGTTNSWVFGWNKSVNAFDMFHWTVEPVVRYAAVDNGYSGYAGASTTSMIFPRGVVLGDDIGSSNVTTDARQLCMKSSAPSSGGSPGYGYHLKGDFCFNTNPSPGGPIGWVDMADGNNFASIGALPAAGGLPTWATGACSGSVVSTSGTYAGFRINTGTGACGSTYRINLPTVTNDWMCDAVDEASGGYSPPTRIQQTGHSFSDATFTNYSIGTTPAATNFPTNKQIMMRCTPIGF